jgi:hypothetical protein
MRGMLTVFRKHLPNQQGVGGDRLTEVSRGPPNPTRGQFSGRVDTARLG